MKLVKMFGLTAIAAVAAMAFVGVSSASATSTVLCEVNELVCPKDKKIEHKTIIGLSTNPVLLTNIANVTCAHSEITGVVLLLASPLVGHLKSIKFTTCKESLLGTSCSVVPKENLGLLLLLKTGPNLGLLSGHDVEALVNCSSLGLHCIYGSPETELHVKGSNGSTLATITAANIPLPKLAGGLFCPNTSKWDATYAVSKPHQVIEGVLLPAVDFLYIAE